MEAETLGARPRPEKIQGKTEEPIESAEQMG